MIRFNPYKGDPFTLYKEAVSRCKGDKKKTLTSIEKSVEAMYAEYNKYFAISDVHNVPQHSLPTLHDDYLKSLYSSQSLLYRLLIRDFNSRLDSKVYQNKCPYCMYEAADTMEHILPKEDFQEYAIHAYNLIPCCSLCNSHKGRKVRNAEGDPEFLNFYYHNPDSAEFLKLEISMDKNDQPEFHYRLSFPTTVDPLLKRIIINHFDNLNLLKRLDDKVISTYTSEEVKIILNLRDNSVDETLKIIEGWLSVYAKLYGNNHYYTVLLRLLVSSPIYKTYLTSCKARLE